MGDVESTVSQAEHVDAHHGATLDDLNMSLKNLHKTKYP